jgi:hypothetical protein
MAVLPKWLNGDLFSSLRDKTNALFDSYNTLIVGTTDQVLKKVSGTDFDFTWSNSYLPGSGFSGNIKTKKIAIGDWDMDTLGNPSISPVHGVDAAKIIDVVAMIVSDTGIAPYITLTRANGSSDGLVSGGITINTTTLTLFRVVGGVFDSASYNSTSFNRGYVYITYEE